MKPFAHVSHARLHRRLRRYKEEFLRRHFGRPRRHRFGRRRRWPSISSFHQAGANVVGVGFGSKIVGGAGVSSTGVLRIYVRRKRPLHRLSRAERIPPTINGLPTDVIEVNEVVPAQRPAMGGCSGGNRKTDPGTLGCLVRERSLGIEFVLSCFHVLADISNPILDDPIYEPAWQDGVSFPMGKLYRWMNVNVNGGNLVDCAMASIDSPGDFVSGLRGIGQVNPNPIAAALQQPVTKSGRDMPGVTHGVIDDISADVAVQYPELPQSVGFVHQIAIRGDGGSFSDRGDSGALIVERGSLRPVGLLFAVGRDSVGNSLTFAGQIGPVLDDLNVDVV